MQVAAFTGLRVRGAGAAVACFAGLGLPAFVLMLGLSAAYQRFGGVDTVVSIMDGLKVVVVSLIAFAALDFGRKTIASGRDALLAAAVAVFLVAGGSPALGILASMLVATFVYRGHPHRPPDTTGDNGPGGAVRRQAPAIATTIFLAAGLALLALWERSLFDLGIVMAKVGALAFGGGYGLVPLLLHDVVGTNRWMSTEMLMDGIALGQVTPGPIFITATFIGYHVQGLAGALVATAAIFTPPLAILFVTARSLDRLERSPIIQRALRGALVSFAGLLVATTYFFALAAPWSPVAVALALAAFAALLARVDMLWVVLLGGAVAAFLL
jgi:chromate transporter